MVATLRNSLIPFLFCCKLVSAQEGGTAPAKPDQLPPPSAIADSGRVGVIVAPLPLEGETPLAINLPTALRLMNAQALDIAIASERVRIADALLQRANVLWLPTIANGVDYQHHDGPVQNLDGSVSSTSRSAFAVGMAPEAVFSITDAIFEPLAARQIVLARRADFQAVTNDTMLSVATAYFDVQQARGDLAAAEDVTKRTRQVLQRVESMSPGLVPSVEVARARTQLRRFEQTEQSARERWNVASAELVRIIRLRPTAVVMPLEQPHLQITLIPPERRVDELLPIALTARPELAEFQALVQAALQRWRQERARPFIPSIYARGNSTQLPDSMGLSAYSSGHGGSLGGFGLRDDFEVQAMWELQNLGFGNRAVIRQRKAEYETANLQAYRIQDFVAREVAQAYAQLRSAANRVKQAEEELKEAIISANENYEGLGQVKRAAGNINILIIRPQEAVAAEQALGQAYVDYYGTVADYNRAEFSLYRALGNPAQQLYALGGQFYTDDCNVPPGANLGPAPPPAANPKVALPPVPSALTLPPAPVVSTTPGH
jgi:outer membrane protein TolC